MYPMVVLVVLVVVVLVVLVVVLVVVVVVAVLLFSGFLLSGPPRPFSWGSMGRFEKVLTSHGTACAGEGEPR